jgi:hypothetical protein
MDNSHIVQTLESCPIGSLVLEVGGGLYVFVTVEKVALRANRRREGLVGSRRSGHLRLSNVASREKEMHSIGINLKEATTARQAAHDTDRRLFDSAYFASLLTD